MVQGRSIMPAPHCCQTVLMYSLARGPCVSADTFEESLGGPRGSGAAQTPLPAARAVPEPCGQGGDHGVTWRGGQRLPRRARQSFPGPPSSLASAKTQIELSVPPSVPPSPNTSRSPHQRG